MEIFEGTVELPNLPEKCRDCPVQSELTRNLILSSIVLQKEVHDAATLVGDDGERFDELVDENFADSNTEDERNAMKKEYRRQKSVKIDSMEEGVTRTRQEIDANVLACQGVLKMRAARGDITYTVAVCTSAKQYLVNAKEPKEAPAKIWASQNSRTRS